MLMEERKWHILDGRGVEITNLDIERPSDANSHNGDYATPWYKTYNHLHGKRGTKGIHYFGTFADALAELDKAWRGQSELPVDE